MSTSKKEQQHMLHRVQRSFRDSQADKRLCLLSLDGGGVRGLSTLYILRKIMTKVSAERQKKGQDTVKPCQVFDLIGGTSTGGLIAILLGRLEMTVEECITLYKTLMGAVFGQKEHFLKVKLTTGKMQNVFSQEPLREAIEELLRSKGIPVDQLYDDGQERTSRTFVVARRMESKNAVVIRDYTELGDTNDDRLTIVEAALATSAASTFFPPLEARGKSYVDGALGTNNPTPLVWQVAQDIWANHDGHILDQVNCFISLGTGKPSFTGIKKSAWGFLTETMEQLVTQTEETETNFAKNNRFLIPLEGEQKYYRFNVQSGLESVDIQEHKKEALIEVATNEYLNDDQKRKFEVDRCSMRVALKELNQDPSISFRVRRTPVFVSDETKMECNECIRSLLRPEAESLSEDVKWYRHWDRNIKNPNPSSLEWLWERDTSLSKWMEAKNGTFWIRGKEGSGKSVAMKHFFTEYKKRRETEFVICFFFNKLGSDLEKCFEGLLRVVLARIMRGYPALFTCIQHHFNHMVLEHPYDRNADWTRGDLEHAMELIINNTQLDANIVLFVDALNECEDKDMGEEKLIQIFRGYSEPKPLVKFKICFSSTTNIDLEEKYIGQLPGLVMQEKTEVDMELYIRTCFNDGKQSSRFDENDLAQILAGVLKKAEGCWLWVEYAVSLVNKRSSTLGTVKRGLEKLPKEMTALYESFLISVNDEHAEETNNMLAIVLAAAASCSPPSISIEDFRYILGFYSEDQYESQAFVEGQDDFMKTNALLRARIQERFGHLLVVQNLDDDDADDEGDSKKRDKNGTVKLYHSTVKDFLSQRKTAGESLILSGQDLERRGFEILTTASLRFFQCREVTKLAQDLESQGVKYFRKVEDASAVFRRLPLLVFTLRFFLINSCYAIQRNTGNSDKLKAYWTNRNFEVWKSTTNILLERDAIEPDATLTALCIETDCDVFVRYQIENQGVEPNELIPDYGSYLCLAAFWGSDKVVKMLLSLRPHVDIDFCSSFGTALTIAAARGYKDIVRDLLDNGADADISGGIYEDPLAAASTSLNFDIVRLLWEHPSSSSSLKHSKCRTSRALLAIGGAIRYAFIVEDAELSNSERRVASEVIQLLVRNGLEMSIFTHISVPIFLWSLSIGSTEVMDLMLKDPTFILFQSSSGQTLLHIVSTTATLDMVKLIIKKYEDLGRSIDVRDGRECTVLHYAAINGSPDVIQYLLGLKDPQLDPNAKDMYGLTPLHAAFANGRAKTVRLLLEAGAIIDDDGPEGLSMLHLAVSNFGEPEVLEILTDRPVNVTDNWDRTPLHIASQFGGHKAVEWLLDRNLDPSTRDARGRTALHCACQNQAPSSTEIMELLLRKGASPSATDAAGSTPLHSAFHDPEHASSCLFWAVLEKNYWDKFSEAECTRKVYFMLALDQEDEFINIQDDLGNTPLHLACWRGLGAIIGILISLRARLDLRDKSGCLAYQLIENSELRESAEIIMTVRQGKDKTLEIISS